MRDLGHVVIVQVNPVIGLLIGGEGLLEWTTYSSDVPKAIREGTLTCNIVYAVS